MALGGRAARRAAGLSSLAVSPSSSGTTSRLRAADVFPASRDNDPGVECGIVLPLLGVPGDCIGLAKGRLRCCCAGVVDAGRVDGGGDKAEERLRGLFTGSEDWADTVRSSRSGVLTRCVVGDANDNGL